MSPKSAWLLQEEIVPRLKSAIPQTVCCVGSENAEELVQDATAFAAKMLVNVERSRKKVTPGNISYYCIQHLKSGRRSTGSSISDVYGSATQLNGRTRLTSLDELATTDEENGGEIFEFHDVLASGQEDPSTRAARRIDWQSLCTRLAPRENSIVELMSQGKEFTAIARKLRVSVSTVHTARQQLATKILEFLGPQILAEILKRPQWQQDILATRAKMACREERRH